jgi:hypothetical protein
VTPSCKKDTYCRDFKQSWNAAFPDGESQCVPCGNKTKIEDCVYGAGETDRLFYDSFVNCVKFCVGIEYHGRNDIESQRDKIIDGIDVVLAAGDVKENKAKNLKATWTTQVNRIWYWINNSVTGTFYSNPHYRDNCGGYLSLPITWDYEFPTTWDYDQPTGNENLWSGCQRVDFLVDTALNWGKLYGNHCAKKKTIVEKVTPKYEKLRNQMKDALGCFDHL